ncbi:MAG: DNA polymerase III subunit delta' [Arenimonas sp.]
MKFAPWQQQVFDSAVQMHVQGRLGHAQLLVGPPHLGKRAVAEALANRLLCAAPRADGFACGQCRSCRMFPAQTIGLVTTQAHADLQRVGLEPNEKGDKLRSEITVEQIRRLGQWFSLTAQFGGAQVAIIEPADLMNHFAANALLKTLEEPSPNRFLLIVSSRPGRLPATIRSRCQRLEFRLPPADVATACLRERGFGDDQIGPALMAARGNPGLAEHWLGDGGLQLRSEVLEQLEAVGAGRADAVATGQRWMADDSAELRLRFVADLALEAAAGRWQAGPPTARRLTGPRDFMTLSNWFDSVNRAREQLRAPLRHDLVMAGLLHEWRNMFQ